MLGHARSSLPRFARPLCRQIAPRPLQVCKTPGRGLDHAPGAACCARPRFPSSGSRSTGSTTSCCASSADAPSSRSRSPSRRRAATPRCTRRRARRVCSSAWRARTGVRCPRTWCGRSSARSSRPRAASSSASASRTWGPRRLSRTSRRASSSARPPTQCRRWLAEHLPAVPTEAEASNARAAERARAEEGTAAIAGEAAAETYGLAVLSRAINDEPGNLTRFVVLAARDAARPTGDDKTSILFSVRDEVGILARMLKPFAAHGIDLIKIESRPLRGRPWEYVFYLDLKGHRRERRVEQALAEVGRGATRLKVLGSYPAAPPEG